MKTLASWGKMAGEQGRISKMAFGYLSEEMDRRKNDGEMGEYVVLVKNKFASKNCKEKQTVYATFMTQRRRVFRDRGSMCKECSKNAAETKNSCLLSSCETSQHSSMPNKRGRRGKWKVILGEMVKNENNKLWCAA